MKQRILLVTKFYYRRGGDCIYTLNLERLLLEQGHDVAVFSMQHPENLPSKWSEYWPTEVSFTGNISKKLTAFQRTLGLGDVKSQFARLLKDFAPDVVHLNNIHSYLSPVVAKMAQEFGAKVVWTLHDYKLLCPSYSCFRNEKPCELCFESKLPVIKTRCMKNSLAASAIAFVEAKYWNREKLQKNTDWFICPSQFMADKMKQGGFNPTKLFTLCNFLSPEMIESYRSNKATSDKGSYYCFVGRLSKEKGISTLIKAASELPYKLKVAGDGPMSEELHKQFGNCKNIEFLGHLNSSQVNTLLSNAKFSVLPSECYENNPLGVIESFCAGTPVVGAAIGGIPELINPTRGITFESGNINELTKAIVEAWEKEYNYTAIQTQALEEFSHTSYYQRLINEIY